MRVSDIDAAIAEEEALLSVGKDRFTRVERLRSLHERAARICMGADVHALAHEARVAIERSLPSWKAQRAISHLAQAERWQWEIGTWATGSGEGLASMSEVRELQLARAWLLCACLDEHPGAGEAALKLVRDVEHDPNVAKELLPDLHRLRARLTAASGALG